MTSTTLQADATTAAARPAAASATKRPRTILGAVVNGREREDLVADGMLLLDYLREVVGLTGTKQGCDGGECGACTVLVDGVAARACVIPLAGVAGRSVTTLEGLATERGLHPVQQAFVDAQAAQCGYCLNGMLLMTVALLAHTPQPTEREVRQALSRNLCRCGTHVEIVSAALRAAELMAAAVAQPEA